MPARHPGFHVGAKPVEFQFVDLKTGRSVHKGAAALTIHGSRERHLGVPIQENQEAAPPTR
mgnify:FL=1